MGEVAMGERKDKRMTRTGGSLHVHFIMMSKGSGHDMIDTYRR